METIREGDKMSMNSKYSLSQKPYANKVYYANKKIYGLLKRGRLECTALKKAIKEREEAKAKIRELAKYGGGLYGK